MISKLTIRDKSDLPIHYWDNTEVPFLSNMKTLEFSPGLNILVGPNGSGKSTLINLLTTYFHCKQGGHSSITEISIQELIKGVVGEKRSTYAGAKIEHDGNPVFYLKPDKTFGRAGGTFDDDFFEKGLNSVFTYGSDGQLTLGKLGSLFSEAETIDEVQGLNFRNKVNYIWQEWFDLSTKVIFSQTMDKVKKTVIIDEPEKSMDIKNQWLFWANGISRLKEKYQVIVATHSIFSFIHKDATFIETEPGYKDFIQGIIENFKVRI